MDEDRTNWMRDVLYRFLGNRVLNRAVVSNHPRAMVRLRNGDEAVLELAALRNPFLQEDGPPILCLALQTSGFIYQAKITDSAEFATSMFEELEEEFIERRSRSSRDC